MERRLTKEQAITQLLEHKRHEANRLFVTVILFWFVIMCMLFR